MIDEIDHKAHAYWQDDLAKFSPRSKGPTGAELNMYRAGFEEGKRVERERALAALDSGPQNESCGAI